MSADQSHQPLHSRDYLLLSLYCLVLAGCQIVQGRGLTTHEAVHCQNVREMLADHDWLIPKHGGRPWLERPPLPHWITAAFVQVLSHADQEWVYRLGSVLASTVCVLLTAWLAGVWYGRGVALLSGAFLATMREFTGYAIGPEADIFLCAIVTAALALFVQAEFVQGPAAGKESFLGKRTGAVLAFFVLLGLTNFAKGLIFGTLFVLVPAAGYLLGQRSLPAVRRYVWLWGWLAFAAAAAAWPVAAYLRYPGILDLWFSDYLGRLNQGYMREPWWYYLVNLPWIIFPWTVPAGVGLWLTARTAVTATKSPERFLWCWGVLVPVVFSIPQGKHHHYLLHCLTPWAILGALGAVRLWQAVQAGPGWLRNPWWSVPLCAVPGGLAIWALGHKIPGPPALVPVLLLGWPVAAFLLWWAVARRECRTAFGTLLVLVLGLHVLAYGHRTHYLDSYVGDHVFIRQVRETVPAEQPLYVAFDLHPLDSSWFLFYLGPRAALLHNLTFLREERIVDPEVYVITRQQYAADMARYGRCEAVLQSPKTRGEHSPADRWTLYRLHFRPDLQRVPVQPITPMQATGRDRGPYLQGQP